MIPNEHNDALIIEAAMRCGQAEVDFYMALPIEDVVLTPRRKTRMARHIRTVAQGGVGRIRIPPYHRNRRPRIPKLLTAALCAALMLGFGVLEVYLNRDRFHTERPIDCDTVTAVDEETPPPAEVHTDLPRTYHVKALENSANYVLNATEYLAQVIYTEDGYIRIPTGNIMSSGIPGTTVLSYDTNGTLTDEQYVPIVGTDAGNDLHLRYLSDGTTIRLALDEDSGNKLRLIRCDAEGNILRTAEVSDIPYEIQFFLSAGTGLHVREYENGRCRIFVYVGDRVCYYDENLTLLSTVILSPEVIIIPPNTDGTAAGSDVVIRESVLWKNNIYCVSDGVYILGNRSPYMMRIDMNAKSAEPFIPDVSENNTDISGIVYTFSPDGTLYYSTGEALYRVAKSKEPFKLFRWEDVGYQWDGYFWVLSDDCIYYKPQSEDADLVMLYAQYNDILE